MLLSVIIYIIKYIKHLVFFNSIIVGIIIELPLDLKLLAKECRIFSVKEKARIKEFFKSRKSKEFD
jgi:hypothetical protein